MQINRYLAKSSVVAALGGLLFGFDTAVIAGSRGQSEHRDAAVDLGVKAMYAEVGTFYG